MKAISSECQSLDAISVFRTDLCWNGVFHDSLIWSIIQRHFCFFFSNFSHTLTHRGLGYCFLMGLWQPLILEVVQRSSTMRETLGCTLSLMLTSDWQFCGTAKPPSASFCNLSTGWVEVMNHVLQFFIFCTDISRQLYR